MNSRWRALIATVVLLLGIVGVWLYRVQLDAKLPPTGDALFDKYAAAVWFDYRTRLKKDREAAPHGSVSLSTLDEWKADWDEDPRYWELRARAAMHDQLQAGGKKSSSVKQLLQNYKESGRLELLEGYSKRRLSANGVLVLYELSKELKHTSDLDEYLARAIELDPLNPWAWYARGLARLEAGKKDEALADLTRGNALPPAPFPALYPFNIFQTALLTDSPEAAKRLWHYDFSGPDAGLNIRNAVVLNITVDDYATNPELMTQVHRFGCRMHQGNPGSLLNALIALSVCGWVKARVIEHAEGCPVDAELNALLADLQGVHNRMSPIGSNWLANANKRSARVLGNGASSPPLINKSQVWVRAQLAKSLPERSRMKWRQLQVEEARYTAEMYGPFFKALEEVSFSQPKTTPGMHLLLNEHADPYPAETNAVTHRINHPDLRPAKVRKLERAIKSAAQKTSRWAKDNAGVALQQSSP